MAKDTSPQIKDKYSPLNTLAMQALRRYGEFHPSTMDADVVMMFIEFANLTIDDVIMHPYASTEDAKLDYYTSQTDSRPVDDRIIVAGLLHLYAAQQASNKYGLYLKSYYQILNSAMWQRLNGNTKIKIIAPDTKYKVNPVNGLAE